jgi:hypothetical protein
VSTNNVPAQVKPKKKPPTTEDGPSSGFKRTKRWVDFTFGYGDTVPPTAVGHVEPGGSSGAGAVGGLGKPGDWDETAPIARPDTPELEEGIPQEAVDNSLLGRVLDVLDNVTPDDMGGLVRGTSEQWLPDIPYVSDVYRGSVGKILGAGLSVTEGGLDVLNWGSEQMNHLGSALVSWLPGGIQTLDWDQSHDVSFGQSFVSSMGATAGRLERGEAEAGDWMMLPFSLISLGAAQIDPDNIAQDREFNVLNKEQLDRAFSGGAGMWSTGGLDAAWLVAADPTIIGGGALIIDTDFHPRLADGNWGTDPRSVSKPNVIGKKCLIASQTGIAGCVIIKDEVTLWGQVGTTSGITIGEKAVILGQTGVTKSVEGGKTYFGTPIEESREKLKQLANIKRIPEILTKLK